MSERQITPGALRPEADPPPEPPHATTRRSYLDLDDWVVKVVKEIQGGITNHAHAIRRLEGLEIANPTTPGFRRMARRRFQEAADRGLLGPRGGLVKGQGAKALRQQLIEFDAWLSFRPEYSEVLTAFREAFGTDTSASPSGDSG